jgi:phosphoserine phosphatase RsbU/P
MVKYVKIVVLLLFIISSDIFANNNEIYSPFIIKKNELTSLQGKWKIKFLDSKEYSSPSYNDDHWQLVDVPGNLLDLKPGYKGIAWYRTQLKFDETLSTHPYKISLGKIVDADEVYFNGKLIGSIGSIDNLKIHSFDRCRYYVIPCNLINFKEMNTLAVKTRGYLDGSSGMIWGDQYLGREEEVDKKIIFHYLFESIFISFYLFIGFFFIIFSRYKMFLSTQQRIFAIFTLLIAGYLFCIGQFKYLLTDHFYYFHLAQYLILLAIEITGIFLIRFLYRQKLTIIDKITGSIFLLTMLPFLIVDEINYWTLPRLVIQIGVLYFVVIIIINIFSSLKSKKNKNFLINSGFVIFLISAIMEVLRAYTITPDFDYFKFGFPALILLITFFIAEQISIINQIETRAIERLDGMVSERTYELTNRNNQIESELEIARMIQKKLLPDQSKLFIGINFFALSIAMDKIGGDFYDYYKNNENARFIIADVSGHGVASAFLALIAKYVFSETAGKDIDEIKLLDLLNKVVLKFTVSSYFITAVVLTIDVNKMKCSFSNAGHHPILLYRRKTAIFHELYVKGKALGWFEKFSPNKGEFDLEINDRIIMYTDGFIESFNKEMELFGMDRFKKGIEESINLSPEDSINKLKEMVFLYTASNSLEDDISIIIIDIL